MEAFPLNWVPNPVEIHVSGDIINFNLFTSKETHIKVGGDMKNSNFSGQNLHAGDKTTIDVAGQIIDRSLFSFVHLDQSPLNLQYSVLTPQWASIFYLALDPSVTAANLVIPPGLTPAEAAQGVAHLFPGTSPNPGFLYDTATRRLGFVGQMRQDVLQKLDTKKLTVLVYDKNGNPEVENGHLKTTTVLLGGSSAIEAAFAASQDAPAAGIVQSGYRIGGPGEFNVHGRLHRLGQRFLEIFSCGVSDAEGGANRYNNLASLTAGGRYTQCQGGWRPRHIDIHHRGSGWRQCQCPRAAVSMNLGSQSLFDSTTLAAGILPDPSKKQEGYGIMATGVGADVNVIAGGDINVQSSRIAGLQRRGHQHTINGGKRERGNGGNPRPVICFFTYVNPLTGLASDFTETVLAAASSPTRWRCRQPPYPERQETR